MSSKTFAFILAVLWITFISGVLINSISATPFQLPFRIKRALSNTFPEGWGFFTKNPRELSYQCYWSTNNKYKSAIQPCTNRKFWFGISRECRVIGAEVQHLADQIADSVWIKGRNKKDIEFEFTELKDSLNNYFRKPTILGEVVLVKTERLPWAWSKKYKGITTPYYYVKVHVSKN